MSNFINICAAVTTVRWLDVYFPPSGGTFGAAIGATGFTVAVIVFFASWELAGYIIRSRSQKGGQG